MCIKNLKNCKKTCLILKLNHTQEVFFNNKMKMQRNMKNKSFSIDEKVETSNKIIAILLQSCTKGNVYGYLYVYIF